ncbi:MAG: FGGY family carbohydrate kinase [Ilumatobacteraceae bacterium]
MILVIDVGTTGLRAAVVRPDGVIAASEYRPCPPTTPFPGLVEFDPAALADSVVDAARTVVRDLGHPRLDGVGIANQRASVVVWDRRTGAPIGPGLGWQDLRTVGECLGLAAEHGLRLAPNQTATKIPAVLQIAQGAGTLVDDWCAGTIDSWIAWNLSGGEVHATDHTNAAVTGLYSLDGAGWHEGVCDLLDIPVEALPRIVDTAGPIGSATALVGAPPIAALVGDQQASLIGQGCLRPGDAKITFGTGGMLDVCTGDEPPPSADRSAHGTFPIVARSTGGRRTWGAEAIMLAAGSNVEWLVHDLGIVADAAATDAIAASCTSSEGVVYVPALLGLGTPTWDYGARGTLLGLTRGSETRHVVRAVLEGIAHRGADLVEAAEADTGLGIDVVRVDGGMSRNRTFVQALADFTGRAVEVAAVPEATTLGAARLAGSATQVWSDLDEACSTGRPSESVAPSDGCDREATRREWARAVERSARWIPELSALDF